MAKNRTRREKNVKRKKRKNKMLIEIDKIKSSPFQPRLEFNLNRLKEAISKDGILIPLIVRKVDTHYELIDGERRWRIAKELGFKTVPCDVVEATDGRADDLIWELNEDRKSYEPKERAFRYRRFREQGMTYKAIAEKHHETPPIVRAYLGIFELPLKYQDLVWKKKIGIGIIQELLPLLNGKMEGSTFHQITEILDRTLTDEHFGLMEVRKELKKRNGKLREAGENLVQIIEPEIQIETPEDYEKAAQVLKQEAKKRREATLTEKEKREIRAEEERKSEDRKLNEQQRREEKKSKEEARIRKKAKEIRYEELIQDPEFLRQANEKIKAEEKKSILEQHKKEIQIHINKELNNRPKIYNCDYRDFLDRIENNSQDLLITDPPYSTDIEDIEEFANDWVIKALDKIKPTGRAFICIGAYPKELKAYLDVLSSQNKFILDNPLIWTYRNTLGQVPKMKYNLNYQVILHLYSERSRELDTKIINEMFSVQDVNAPDGRQGDRYHTWQKPIELARRLITHTTQEGDRIFDCFVGTGTFMLMGAKLGRKVMGCDNSKDILKIAEERGCEII
ncbi:Nucleoid occlusion protein [subsurface metagenome]